MPPGQKITDLKNGGWQPWLAPAIAVVAVVVVLATLFGGAAPASSRQLSRPIDLFAVARTLTTTSVTLRWHYSTTGPRPDQFLIRVNGQPMRPVPGTATAVTMVGLIPGTSYTFQIFAVRNGQRSDPAAVLSLRTQVPPASGARLSGAWLGTFSVTNRISSSDFMFYKGMIRHVYWRFTPDCVTGACSVMLRGQIIGRNGQHVSFAVHLARSGAFYVGHRRDVIDSCPDGKPVPWPDRLTIKLTVTQEQMAGSVWSAASWAGTVRIDNIAVKKTACRASAILAGVRS